MPEYVNVEGPTTNVGVGPLGPTSTSIAVSWGAMGRWDFATCGPGLPGSFTMVPAPSYGGESPFDPPSVDTSAWDGMFVTASIDVGGFWRSGSYRCFTGPSIPGPTYNVYLTIPTIGSVAYSMPGPFPTPLNFYVPGVAPAIPTGCSLEISWNLNLVVGSAFIGCAADRIAGEIFRPAPPSLVDPVAPGEDVVELGPCGAIPLPA
jgi:hypothetical protein